MGVVPMTLLDSLRAVGPGGVVCNTGILGNAWIMDRFEPLLDVGLLRGLSRVPFLLLAALYESWTVPVSVLLVVPLGVLGSVLFSMARGLSVDVYFYVGLITIIGLAAKNAILIVKFAIEEEAKGKSTVEATMNAVKLRLRPIIMTSLAFLLGMVPLVRATGAGAASRIAAGTGVAGRMLTATLLGILFIPVFYLSVRRWLTRKRPLGPGMRIRRPSVCMRSAAATLCLTLISGCQFAPRHVRPPLPTAQAFPRGVHDWLDDGRRAASIGSREFIQDPRLKALIATAHVHNRDLAVSVAQIDEARGFYRIQNADRLPTVAGER